MTRRVIMMSVAGTDTPDILKPNKETMEGPPSRRLGVYLVHDDYTPPEFVATALQCHFGKSAYDAHMLAEVRRTQRKDILGGVYPPDVAETIQAETMACAQLRQHPLRVRVQPL